MPPVHHQHLNSHPKGVDKTTITELLHLASSNKEIITEDLHVTTIGKITEDHKTRVATNDLFLGKMMEETLDSTDE